MKSYCVYKHTTPSGKVYIGITSKPPQTRWNHGRAYWQNEHFANAINLYGWENITHEVLFENLTKEDACNKERELIAQYRSNESAHGYNRSAGGEYPNEGTIMSEDFRRQKSEARKGKKMPPSYGAAISNAKKGRSNGHEGQTGALCGRSGIVYQIDEMTGETVRFFYGYDEMSRMTGFAKTPVKEAVAGRRKRAYGFIWTYQKRGASDVII